MAEKTFKNLKPERQEDILLASFREFALKGYQNASLSEIIKTLGLAKGSFYRYFKSKKLLYAYLIEEASRRRLTKLDDLINDPNADFFHLIKQNFIDKSEFDKKHPLIGAFLYKIMHEKDNSEVSDIIKSLYKTIIEQTKKILAIPRFKSQLNIVDPTMVAFQIFHTQLWLYDYVAFKYNINFDKNIIKNRPVMDLNTNELLEVIDRAVKMLRNGISK